MERVWSHNSYNHNETNVSSIKYNFREHWGTHFPCKLLVDAHYYADIASITRKNFEKAIREDLLITSKPWKILETRFRVSFMNDGSSTRPCRTLAEQFQNLLIGN